MEPPRGGTILGDMSNDPNVFRASRSHPEQPSPKKVAALAVVGVVIVAGLFVAMKSYRSVEAGHVAVSTLFGKVNPDEYGEGLHFPVNPLLEWTAYDVREKTHMETAGVPTQDQLTTEIDVSVQYNIKGDAAARMLGETGTAADAVDVHLVPKLRSLMREQGKSIRRAEDFFLDETQQMLERNMFDGLSAYLEPKGINVQAVLVRRIDLPAAILQNIELKKQAEQRVEQSKAELEKVKVEAQQRVEEAKAEREAAEQEAEQRKLLADAQAYEIEKINTAIANNPAYIQLESLKALTSISKDPSSKLYFLNGDSPQPLPLMNIGGDNPVNAANR